MVGSAEISHPDDCCIYLLDAGDLVLVDSGAGQSFNKLVANIESLGFNIRRLKAILVTHAHIDHIGSLHQFRGEFGAQIIAHEFDAGAIESGIGVKAVHIPGHTPGSIAAYVDINGKRILFGQDIHGPYHPQWGGDIHGPYHPQWGGDPVRAKQSLQKLVDLRADILCEGHFGIYQPGTAVTSYIGSYIDSL